MPLRPFCNPIGRDDLAEKILSFFDAHEWEASLKDAVPFVRQHVDRVLTIVAPEHMETKRALLLPCRDSAAFILRRTLEEFPKIPRDRLKGMRRQICAQIGLVFYQEYIDRFIREVAVPYLPQSWQAKCQLVQQEYCPYEWAECRANK